MHIEWQKTKGRTTVPTIPEAHHDSPVTTREGFPASWSSLHDPLRLQGTRESFVLRLLSNAQNQGVVKGVGEGIQVMHWRPPTWHLEYPGRPKTSRCMKHGMCGVWKSMEIGKVHRKPVAQPVEDPRWHTCRGRNLSLQLHAVRIGSVGPDAPTTQ